MNDTERLARKLSDEQRQYALFAYRGLQHEMTLIEEDWKQGVVRSHNLEPLIQRANDMRLHLLRAEAYEAFVPRGEKKP